MEEARILLADIIKELAKSAASSLVKKAKEYLIDMSKKEEIDVGDAYEVYLTKVYNTYSKSKSLIYGSEARDLLSFFQPVDLRLVPETYWRSNNWLDRNRRSNDKVISSSNLIELFDKGTKIIITGSGGVGKTILMKYFCLKSIEIMNKIPVFISLRWFNTWDIDNKEKKEDPFEKLIYEQLKVFDFKLSYDYFLYSLEGNRYIFLLDGFDEIARDRSAFLSHKLSDFTRRYNNNYIIVSSRQNERLFWIDEYKIYEVCPLAFDQAKGLIEKLDLGDDVKERFIKDLNSDIYQKYRSFISIPLLLSILFITYTQKASIPESLTSFYEEAFETLLYIHDRRKEGLERVLSSKLYYEDFKTVFLYFCFITYFKDEYSFTETSIIRYLSYAAKESNIRFDRYSYLDDITNIACMMIKEGQEYLFIHRSIQEYFAALYVSQVLEEEQKELCSAFLRDNIVLDRSYRFNHVNGKVVDFMTILYLIEPKRFEHIVVLPILKRIHALYIENDNNLLKTSKILFYKDLAEKPLRRFRIEDINNLSEMNVNEFNILIVYYYVLSLKIKNTPRTSSEKILTEKVFLNKLRKLSDNKYIHFSENIEKNISETKEFFTKLVTLFLYRFREIKNREGKSLLQGIVHTYKYD